MIDCHCHLEQKDYDKDREQVIEQCKQEIKFLVTSCAHPKDFDLTLDIARKHDNFVFAAIGIHPTYIKETNEQEIKETIEKIRKNKESIVAIGETGLDFHWIKEPEWREKQKVLFVKMIQLAKDLHLPLIIHSWDATTEVIEILEQQGMKGKKVLMHLLSNRKVISKVIENDWFVSIGPGIRKSKDIRKIARDVPIHKILLETDSPWFAQEGQTRGLPLNVKIPAEKIAEIKKLPVKVVEKQTDLNAIVFFNLEK
jgi:TatD DNase family protein